MQETQGIDRGKLDGLRQELGADFRRIFGYFREDGAKSIGAIENAVRAQSAVALVRPAHTLKGEALQFGAMQLGAMAAQVERCARRAVQDNVFPSGCIEYVVQLRPLFEEAIAMIEREIASATPIGRIFGFGRRVATGC